ncbi:MAG: hypothetical protein P8Z37_06435 [Acidobacteriota bacterium]
MNTVWGRRRKCKRLDLLREESGSALLLALLTISIFSLLGLFIMYEAMTGLRISDNYESRVRAEAASIAGLNHAQALMRGLLNDPLLAGPDGNFDTDASYLNFTRQYEFRNPFSIGLARNLKIRDPAADLSGVPDDGLINSGSYSGSAGIPLIPLTGIAQKYSDPDGTGEIVVSRYFVKVTDNNDDASEKTKDPAGSPFVDGDGEVIVRSMGVSGTLSEYNGSTIRKNSVAVFEARYRKFFLFDFGPALLIAGAGLNPAFSGDYEIDGGSSPGIGFIDSDQPDIATILATAPFGSGSIVGAGLPDPSIADLTIQALADPERSRILQPDYLLDFVLNKARRFADNYFEGNQSWNSENEPDLGYYSPMKSFNAPDQNPKVTVVQGDLVMSGNAAGGGLLIVTGTFQCLDACSYNGLILVIGSGGTVIDTGGPGITGGVVVVNLQDNNGIPVLGSPSISVRGNSRIRADAAVVKMAQNLIPPVRTSFREIAGTDP